MPQSKTFEYPETSCPMCHHVLDAVAIDPRAPRDRSQPGDFTICFYCAAILVFREGSRIDLPTVQEKGEIEKNPVLYVTLQMAQQKVLRSLPSRGAKS